MSNEKNNNDENTGMKWYNMFHDRRPTTQSLGYASFKTIMYLYSMAGTVILCSVLLIALLFAATDFFGVLGNADTIPAKEFFDYGG